MEVGGEYDRWRRVNLRINGAEPHLDHCRRSGLVLITKARESVSYQYICSDLRGETEEAESYPGGVLSSLHSKDVEVRDDAYPVLIFSYWMIRCVCFFLSFKTAFLIMHVRSTHLPCYKYSYT